MWRCVIFQQFLLETCLILVGIPVNIAMRSFFFIFLITAVILSAAHLRCMRLIAWTVILTWRSVLLFHLSERLSGGGWETKMLKFEQRETWVTGSSCRWQCSSRYHIHPFLYAESYDGAGMIGVSLPGSCRKASEAHLHFIRNIVSASRL